MLITEDYRLQNQELHARGNYGVTAPRHVNTIVDLAHRYGAKTVLDYGSGTKRWCERFFEDQPDIHVSSYDPCVVGLENNARLADLVVCCDVLEHIEPDCLDDVLNHLQSCVDRAFFFSIATRPAKKILPDGRNAHLLVRSAGWWLLTLMPLFTVRSYLDGNGEAIIWGEKIAC